MAKWESWRNNSSHNSTSDTRKHRANCSEDHLKRVGIDRHLTDQDVERKNCSGGNNQISADDRDDAPEGEKESVQHEATLHYSAPLAYGQFGQILLSPFPHFCELRIRRTVRSQRSVCRASA